MAWSTQAADAVNVVHNKLTAYRNMGFYHIAFLFVCGKSHLLYDCAKEQIKSEGRSWNGHHVEYNVSFQCETVV